MKQSKLTTLILCCLLTVAFGVQAQTSIKVAPKMQKGMEKTYVVIHKTTLPGQPTFEATLENKYTVVDITSDGYVLELRTKTVKTDYDPNSIAAKLYVESGKFSDLITYRFSVDKNGKVVKVLNVDEIVNMLEPKLDKMIGDLFDEHPELAMALPKDTLKAQFMCSMDEKAIMHELQKNAGPLALNGKTIMTGSQEDYTSAQGWKMKRMYVITGKKIVASSSLDLTKEEKKDIILKQVKQLIPEQFETVKQNFDQLQQTGALEFGADEIATYELDKDGWVKIIDCNTSMNNFQQKSGTITIATLK